MYNKDAKQDRSVPIACDLCNMQAEPRHPLWTRVWLVLTLIRCQNRFYLTFWCIQGGITCGAIDEPRKSSKAIDECVIINFRDKNVIIARFCDKNVVIARFRDKTAYVWGLRYRWDPLLSRNPVPRFPHFMPPCLRSSLLALAMQLGEWDMMRNTSFPESASASAAQPSCPTSARIARSRISSV